VASPHRFFKIPALDKGQRNPPKRESNEDSEHEKEVSNEHKEIDKNQRDER
jgi:hypothetical protein